MSCAGNFCCFGVGGRSFSNFLSSAVMQRVNNSSCSGCGTDAEKPVFQLFKWTCVVSGVSRMGMYSFDEGIPCEYWNAS